jgi:ABC-type nickel/cobalt efflux system permease component RcnA
MLGAVLAPASPAGAHPPGQTFAIYQYEGLTLTPDRVRVTAVLNTAELVTRQDRRTADADHDGTITATEQTGYAAVACASLAADFKVSVDGRRLAWTVPDSIYAYEHGTGGLPSARLTCHLEAPADLAAPATVAITNEHRADLPGWRELTAVGQGVHVIDSLLPQRSVSDELRAIPPADALTLDVRNATIRVAPGDAPGAAAAPTPVERRAGLVASGTTWAERRFEALAGGSLTPVLAVVAVLAALLLGAGHALLPGHGKTVLAAYLAGRRGRPWDAVAVGGAVTVSHTGAVLVVGTLISAGTALAGERLLGWLGAVSGLLIMTVGTGMLVAAVRRRAPHHDHGHPHSPDHLHGPGHGHSHDHGHPHSHDHHHHHDGHHHHGGFRGRLGLAGIGLAGGLLPSPSALVVLLASIGLGRAAFGVLLVLAYGLGMAGTLTLAGLLLLAVQRRIAAAGSRPARLLDRLTGTSSGVWPLVTASVVLIVGLGMVVRAGTSLSALFS